MNEEYIIQRSEGAYWSEEDRWTYDRMDAKEFSYEDAKAKVDELQNIYQKRTIICANRI